MKAKEEAKVKQLGFKQITFIVAFGLVGWALCGAIMFVGMATIDMQTTLILHAIGASIIFGALSWIYHTRFRYTSPIQTGVLFLSIVMLTDLILVGLVINKSLDMFASPLGTWIPFGLIFLSTYLTGRVLQTQGDRLAAA
jgi:hypothetical protein